MTDESYGHCPAVDANQRHSLAFEHRDSARISTCDLAQVLVGHNRVSERDPCSIPTATHRGAYYSWLYAVCGKRFTDPPRVRFALRGEHRFTIAVPTLVPDKRVPAGGLGVADKHYKIPFGLKLVP